MNRTRLGTYLALLLFVAAFAGYYRWRASYGVTGQIQRLNFPTAGYIAFVKQDAGGKTDLYVVNADSTGAPKRLTDDQGPKRAPAWSPDGTQLCYAGESLKGSGIASEGSQSGEAVARFQIFVLGAGDPVQATYGSLGKDQPQWSADGKYIAFLAGGTIKSIGPHGENPDQVYPPPVRSNAPGSATGGDEASEAAPDAAGAMRAPPITTFRWAPTGQAIAALQVVEGEAAGAMGQAEWWLSDRPPAATPNGTASVIPEPESIILLPAIGARPLLLPHAQGNRVGYAWFRDGTRLACALDTRRGRHQIAIWRADETAILPQLVFESEGYTVAPENPVPSPDGSQIAYEVWRFDSPENRSPLGLAVVSTDPVRVTRVRDKSDIGRLNLLVKGEATNPKWSPDGKHILFLRSGKGGRDLWVVDADGSHPRNLTKGQGDNFDPCWSPRK